MAIRATTYLTALQDELGTSAVNIAGLAFQIEANETWSFECYLLTGETNASGMKIAISTPGSATLLATAIGTTSGPTAYSSDLMSVSATLGIAFNTVNAQTGIIRVSGVVANGNNAGSVQMMFADVGGTATIRAGSTLVARRIS